MNKLKFLVLLMFTPILLFSQSIGIWEFAQGYILTDSTVIMINKPLQVDVTDTYIHINEHYFYYSKYYTVRDTVVFTLQEGDTIGRAIYTETPKTGAVLSIYYANINVVMWSKYMDTFLIHLK